jgi:hypothetical protein
VICFGPVFPDFLIVRGFVAVLAALFLVLGLPALFLTLPGSTMFVVLVPIWIIVMSVVLGTRYYRKGSLGVLSTSGLVIAIMALRPATEFVNDRTRCNSTSSEIRRPRTMPPTWITFDNFRSGYGGDKYDLRDQLAVLTGAGVVEFDRLARNHIGTAWLLTATRDPVCSAPDNRNDMRMLGSRKQRLDMCLHAKKNSGVSGQANQDT